MNARKFFFVHGLAGFICLGIGTCGFAAPLTWFPGPSIDTPVSQAAMVTASDGNNLIIGGDSSIFPQSLAVTNTYWTYLPAVYGIQVAPGAVEAGDFIILYGGTDGTNSTSDVIAYSPSGDTAPLLASMSVARSYLGYTSDAGGNAYAIGGLDDTGQPLASVERYNQDANVWTNIASLPTPLYNFPAVFDHTNQIYIFGGRTNTTAGAEVPTVLRYSTRNRNWTAVAPMPIATTGSAATFGPDGKIYVVGGVSGGVTINAVQVYNPASNSWVVSTPLPEGLSASAMGVDSLGRLIVVGGMDTNGNDVANVWRSQELTTPDSAPVFTQYPATNGKYQVAYNSSIAATGNPQPTFLLMSGPPSMQVNIYSGAISWTPEAEDIGTNAITIRATNYAGYADWTFNIVVPNPPPTAPTNLAVIGVTDNSVTLSWDPESPVAGPTTYRAYLQHVAHSPKGSGVTITYSQIGTNTTIPTITISGLMPGSGQVYYINASAPGGTSGYSAIGATTTSPQGPPSLTVTGVTSTTTSLSWSPSPGPAQSPNYSPIVSYTIMERTLSPLANIPTVTNITGTNATITGLKPGSSHIWFVSGVDAAGNASALTFVYVVVTNPVPVAPQLSAGASQSGGAFLFTASLGGSALQTVTIEATSTPADPNSWVQIGSFLPASNPFTFTDTNAAQFPSRFYRVVVQ